ncbi:hypothetical protein ACEPAH_1678 [Sanghuangporus vaninii]
MDVDSDEGQRDGDVYEPSDEYESSDESSDEYESSDGYESSASSSLIRKPPGEVGRPGRGGYNLQAVLRSYGWSTKSFEKKRKYIFKLIDKHLDTGLSFIYQDDEAVQTVVDAATKHFPQFKDFKNAWPILDFCKMCLKYTASRSRRKAERLAADMFDAQQVKFSLFCMVDASLTMNKEYSEALLSLRALVPRMIIIESLLVRRYLELSTNVFTQTHEIYSVVLENNILRSRGCIINIYGYYLIRAYDGVVRGSPSEKSIAIERDRFT